MPRWLKPVFQFVLPILVLVILARRMNTQLMTAAFFRLQPKLSMALAWRFSNTAMTVEKLAKVMNRKNSGFLVCSFKLQSGLERITKWMMLGLLGLIAVLAVHSLTTALLRLARPTASSMVRTGTPIATRNSR